MLRKVVLFVLMGLSGDLFGSATKSHAVVKNNVYNAEKERLRAEFIEKLNFAEQVIKEYSDKFESLQSLADKMQSIELDGEGKKCMIKWSCF